MFSMLLERHGALSVAARTHAMTHQEHLCPAALALDMHACMPHVAMVSGARCKPSRTSGVTAGAVGEAGHAAGSAERGSALKPANQRDRSCGSSSERCLGCG